MAYTLGQAGRATGKRKSTIQKAIKSGRLSATKNDLGHYRIDPAELHRVYPPVSEDGTPTPAKKKTGEQTETVRHNSVLEAKLEILQQERSREREQAEKEREALENRIADLRAERDNWREEVNKWQEQAQQATRLLTHQKEQEQAQKPGWFDRLLGRTG